MVGGGEYPPRLERLERLFGELPHGLGGGRTLGGCRILPRRGGLLVCREPSAVAPPIAATPGAMTAWDGRFRLHLPADAPDGLTLGALGGAPVDARALVPAAARGSLPALHDERSVVAVPALGYLRAARGCPLDRRHNPPLPADSTIERGRVYSCLRKCASYIVWAER